MSVSLLQQTILHGNDPLGRAPSAISISDATRFVKQGQHRQQLLADQQNQQQQQQQNHPSAKITIPNHKPIGVDSLAAKKSHEYATSQETSTPSSGNGRIQSSQRNRLHPLSTTKTPFGSVFNRSPYHSATTTGPFVTTIAAAATTQPPPATTDRIDDESVGRKRPAGADTSRGNGQHQDNNANRANKLLRQPLFAGREAVQQTIKRINVTHNGSANRDASQEVTNRTHQLQLLQQARQKLRTGASGETGTRAAAAPEPTHPVESSGGEQAAQDGDDELVDEGEEVFYEDDEVDGKGQAPDTALPNSSEENKPVILTSNFFLPGKPLPQLDADKGQQPNDLSNDGEDAKDSADDVIDVEALQPAVEKQHETHSTDNDTEQANGKRATHVDLRTTKPVVEDPNVEYEYEYEEYVDEPTTHPVPSTVALKHATKTANNQAQGEHANQSADHDEHAQHTDRPPIDDSTKSTHSAQIETSVDPVETSSANPAKENGVESTESYVVVASVQTSRSISGARFLTFPQVEQEERKQSLSELEKEGKTDNRSLADNDEQKSDDLLGGLVAADDDNGERVDGVTEISMEVGEAHSDASISTKTDVVRTKVHKLSSVSEKLAHLHELNEPKPELTTKSVPVMIRKFVARTTVQPTRKPSNAPRTVPATQTTSTEPIPSIKPIEDFDDELASLLPPGFRARDAPTRNTTPKMQPTEAHRSPPKPAHDNPNKNKSFGGLRFEEIALDSLLPKGYRPVEDKPTLEVPDLTQILSKIRFEDNIAALLPKDYKMPMQETAATTKPPQRLSTVTEDVAKLLPPGYRLPKETTTKRSMLKTTMDDVSKFLPPGYRLAKTTMPTSTVAPATVPTTLAATTMPDQSADSKSTEPHTEEILKNVQFSGDISSLLPPGYMDKLSDKETASGEETAVSHGTGGTSNANFKLIFPKSLHKRPGARVTTSKPTLLEHGGPPVPGITIRKGLPVR